ncbi:hypothetical protein [Diaminobutyricimonas sp. LJ205]|uniref:hypothetical protein n=1 Tax=Diaminobutyricimonas sp. LJ205 TaxID=2683590 RepID=UPI0012F4F382|nr:hypothetical protein [Diaminobutyricimonas sp. LJ205]
MAIKARLVDERDTMWEQEDLDLRVILKSGPVHSAYDLDPVSFAAAREWARSQGATSYSIGIRTTNNLAQPGLMWLVVDATD